MAHTRMKAISPVIATIIIVAVTIAIAVAVAGWLMGLWSGYTNVPQLKINEAYLYNSTGTLVLLVSNSGTGDAVFQSVQVGDYICTKADAIYLGGSNTPTATDAPLTKIDIKPGTLNYNVTIVCNKWANVFQPGSTVQVKVMLTNGQSVPGIATVKP